MKCGYVYVVNTCGYLDEALSSIASLRKVEPYAEVTIIGPQILNFRDSGINWLDLEGCYDSPIIKVESVRCPYDAFIFLDTDTIVRRPVHELFDLLDGVDMAFAHEQMRGWDYNTSVPRAFCEFNTGVMVVRRSEAVMTFFSEWKRRYDVLRSQLNLVNDQPSFREVLWEFRELRFCTLPSEYHFVTGTPNYIAWDAHILHGREDLVELGNLIDLGSGPRVYVPPFGMVSGFQGRRSVLRSWLSISTHALNAMLGRNKQLVRKTSPVQWQSIVRSTVRDSADE
ncbi:MAG: putative nucleotide-diphospho-sugar transferase [Beijerinckiaceae bacterium]